MESARKLLVLETFHITFRDFLSPVRRNRNSTNARRDGLNRHIWLEQSINQTGEGKRCPRMRPINELICNQQTITKVSATGCFLGNFHARHI